MSLLNGLQVLKDAGINVSKLPKLAETKKIAEAILFGSRSAYRAFLFIFCKRIVAVNYTTGIIDVKELDPQAVGVSPTVASASVGALLGATKSDKLAIYLTLCALGLSDHPESLIKTILGNATKWTRADAYNRYKSDLAFVPVLEQHKDVLAHVRKTFEAIQKQLSEQAVKDAASARKQAK